jgi:5-hydroxyisourate hydrolase-like protein (transthyretin family)
MKLFVRKTNYWKILFVGLLSMLLLPSVMAQDVTLTATPDSIGLEESVTLTASGLTANTTYTLEVLYENDESVFITERTSNNSGQLVLTLTSELSDPPGEYTVTLSQDGAEIATTSFTLTDVGGSSNGGNDDGSANIIVSPSSAAVGNTHDILVSGLESGQAITLQIRYTEDDSLKYTRRLTADDSGRIQIEIFTEENEDEPGDYTILVLDANSVTLGTATLTLEDFIGREGVMTITPRAGDAGSTHTISVTELKPFANLTITVNKADTNERVFLTRLRADVNGEISIEYTSEDDAEAGDYRVEVLEGEVLVASSTLTVGDASMVPLNTAQISITPASGERGTAHTIVVTGLTADSAFTLDVVYVPDETSVYSTDRTANADGNFEMLIESEDGDALGEYRIDIVQDDATIASTTFVITDGTTAQNDIPAEVGTVMITPATAEAGQSHIVTASGLEANASVIVQIVDGDNIIAERTATADVNGNIALSIATTEDTSAGAYTVRVVMDDTVLASTNLTVEGDVVAQPTGDVAITITPPVGVRGTEHSIDVAGLEASETITLEIRLADAVIFSTQLTADDAGNASTVIFSEESDELGDYTLAILRDDAEVASAILTIEDAVATDETTDEEAQPDVPPFEGTITVTPPVGERGAIHSIDVAGLDPNETVTFQVILGEAVLYETERTADANGAFSIDIQADETDAFGVYQVAILRQGVIVGDADLTVTRPVAMGETTEETTTDETPADDVTPVAVQSTGASTVYQDDLNSDAPEIEYTFEGTEGEVIYITLDSTDFDAYLTLRDSDEFIVAENDDGGDSLNSIIGPITLDYDDTYTVVVSSYDYHYSNEVESGDFALTINRGALTDVAYGVPQSIIFDEENSIYFFSFDAEVGEVLRVNVTGDANLDTTLRLIDPYDFEVAFDDDSGSNFHPEINRYVVTQAGTHIIAIAPFSSGATGNAEVVVERRPALTLDDGTGETIQLNSKSSREVLTFTAEAGMAYQLLISETTTNTDYLYISVTQGENYIMDYSASWGIPDELMLGFVVPDAGEISIIVESYSNATLDINIEPAE